MWHYQAGPRAESRYFILVPDRGQSLAQMAGLAQQVAPHLGLLASDSVADLATWGAACDQYGLAPQQAVWLTYGRGGADWQGIWSVAAMPEDLTALLLHPQGLVAEAGAVASLTRGQVFVSAGKRDAQAPAQTITAASQVWTQMGLDVTVFWTMTGAISQGELEAARHWLATVI